MLVWGTLPPTNTHWNWVSEPMDYNDWSWNLSWVSREVRAPGDGEGWENSWVEIKSLQDVHTTSVNGAFLGIYP